MGKNATELEQLKNQKQTKQLPNAFNLDRLSHFHGNGHQAYAQYMERVCSKQELYDPRMALAFFSADNTSLNNFLHAHSRNSVNKIGVRPSNYSSGIPGTAQFTYGAPAGYRPHYNYAKPVQYTPTSQTANYNLGAAQTRQQALYNHPNPTRNYTTAQPTRYRTYGALAGYRSPYNLKPVPYTAGQTTGNSKQLAPPIQTVRGPQPGVAPVSYLTRNIDGEDYYYHPSWKPFFDNYLTDSSYDVEFVMNPGDPKWLRSAPQVVPFNYPQYGTQQYGAIQYSI